MSSEAGDAAQLPPEFLKPYVQRLPARLGRLTLAIVCYAVFEARRALMRILRRRPRAAATGIYYHEVPAGQRAAFARQTDHLARWAQPLRADHLKPLPAGARAVIVTFDDGWLSFVENAAPEMARRRIPATVFVIADYLGRGADGPSGGRLANAQELRRLDPQLVSVGSHSSTHAMLTELSEGDALRELGESRRELEETLGVPISLFCFPYGLYNQTLLRLARAAGYERAFICMPGPALEDPQEFVVSRIRVDPTDWPIEFHLKLMGAYRWVGAVIELKRRFRWPPQKPGPRLVAAPQ